MKTTRTVRIGNIEARPTYNGNYLYEILCYQNPQTCYVIAHILNKEEPDVKCIGIRPWELNDEDKSDFEDVLKYIYEKIIYPTNDD